MKHFLTDGKNYILFDDEDSLLVNTYTWSIDSNGYARHNIYISKGKVKRLALHRFILNAQHGEMVDHINGNKLDNRKSNLRLCTSSTNAANCKVHKHNTSGYKGVSRSGKRWRAYIVKNDKQIHLGCFKTKESAAEAYNKKAVELFGEFAKVNKL